MATQLKNRIHSLGKFNGITINRASLNSARQRESFVEDLVLPGIYMQQVLQIINAIDEKDKEKKQTRKLINREGYRLFPARWKI